MIVTKSSSIAADVIICCVFILICAVHAISQDSKTALRIAIMPLENLTENSEAADFILPFLIRSLRERGYGVIPYENTYRFLLRNRIREIGSVSRATARRIGKEFGAHAILVGSINLFQQDRKNPKIGLSLRMVNAADGSISWARDLSHSGEDSMTYFNLGRIEDIEELTSLAFEELKDSYPDAMKPSEELPPFELEKIIFPRYSKGGKRIKIFAKIIPIYSAPSRVDLLIEDCRKQMFMNEDGIFEVDIKSPTEEARYPLQLICRIKHKDWLIKTGESLIVNNDPPMLRAVCRSPYFSPNGDSISDFTSFSLSDLGTVPLNRWNFTIIDPERKGVVNFGGRGPVPKEIFWNGLDEDGIPVDDGEYYFRLWAEDMAGNINETALSRIVVDTSPPHVEIEGMLGRVGSEKGKGKKVEIDITIKDDSPIRDWYLEVYEGQKRTLKIFKGKGKPKGKIVWEEGNPELKSVKYKFEIADVAGNVQTMLGEIMTKELIEERRKKFFEEIEFE